MEGYRRGGQNFSLIAFSVGELFESKVGKILIAADGRQFWLLIFGKIQRRSVPTNVIDLCGKIRIRKSRHYGGQAMYTNGPIPQ